LPFAKLQLNLNSTSSYAIFKGFSTGWTQAPTEVIPIQNFLIKTPDKPKILMMNRGSDNGICRGTFPTNQNVCSCSVSSVLHPIKDPLGINCEKLSLNKNLALQNS